MSQGVGSIIPKFETGKEWAKTDESHRAAYNKANAAFKKAFAAKFKAQGEERKKLNEEADAALVRLKEAKERIQKKYAKDDPADYGEGPMTSADIANAKLDATAKDYSSGSFGSNGEIGQRKWYTNGVISDDAYTDNNGHYFLGPNRRRVGAGFGRRRRIETVKKNETVGAQVETAEEGHNLLKAGIGAPEEQDDVTAATASSAAQGLSGSDAASYAAMAAATKDILPPGIHEAEKSHMTAEEAAELKASGAGVDAKMDSTAHFTNPTEIKIVGKNATDELQPPEATLVQPL